MSEPGGYLYAGGPVDPAGRADVPGGGFLHTGTADGAGWIQVGITDGGYSISGHLESNAAGRLTYVEERIDYTNEVASVTRTWAPAEWTIGDALAWLHPCPPRRTLSRWLAKMAPIGERALATGGPLARTYAPGLIMKEHARWVAESEARAGRLSP